MNDQIARDRDLRQLRADVANARECEDDYVEVPTGAVETALAEVDRLTPRQITDINEIEAFPVGTILLEHIAQRPGEAMAWRKERDGYWFPSTFSWVRQRGALAMAGVKPVLIHMPTPAVALTAEEASEGE